MTHKVDKLKKKKETNLIINCIRNVKLKKKNSSWRKYVTIADLTKLRKSKTINYIEHCHNKMAILTTF